MVSGLLWVLAALAIIMVVSVGIVVLIARSLYKRVRRSRTVNDTILRTRAGITLGPQRKVLALRVKLRQSIESGRAALAISIRSEGPRGELASLFRRIEAESTVLDSQLRLLASERDSAVLTREAALMRGRVDDVATMIRRLRAVVASGIGGLSDDTLTTLRADVEREVSALHAGLQELHDFNRRDDLIDASRRPSSGGVIRSR